jgi:hypothetical protein
MTSDHKDLFARGNIPNAGRPIVARSHHASPVWTEDPIVDAPFVAAKGDTRFP